MTQEYISIRGGRENNLKNIDLDVPKRKITVFTGVSGSGKSSIVFDTISAEAQRHLNQTFTAFVQNFLPRYSQPDVDSIDNLSTAVIIDQKRIVGNARSTVGTITDIYSLLRLLFSRIGQPFVGYSNVFSFNDPSGMCPECHGIGEKIELDLTKALDTSKSLNQGAILLPNFAVDSWYWQPFDRSGYFDMDKPLADYTETEWHDLLHGPAKKIKYEGPIGSFNSEYEGLVDKFDRLYITGKYAATRSESSTEKMSLYMGVTPCSACNGARLNPATLSCLINGLNIAQYAAMEVTDLSKALAAIDDPIAATMVEALTLRLNHLINIGLGYLSLNRETTSLSGGEAQRIKMIRHLSSSLTDLMYIFDEPSIGLHPRDVQRLKSLLTSLRDKGNTILVVEHDRDVISLADHIIDVGPNAGTLGGEIVYQGTFDGLLSAPTLTGRFINYQTPIKTSVRTATEHFPITNATLHNLKNVSVNVPKGIMTVVTGVAGSGKSSLIIGEFTNRYPDTILIDQSALNANSRSNAATYLGIMDDIRSLFAKANKVNPGLFSFNSKGACPECKGLGFIYTDLAFLEPIKTVCEVCNGKRFQPEVLEYLWHGKSIFDVLSLTAREALPFFEKTSIAPKLKTLNNVGLDYLTLGQPLSTLSGGERQRIKLATELHKNGSIYIMDEPTTGLHMSDVGRLLGIMDHLVELGNTVIVIEHNLDVIKNADWIIDMGPEAGHRGGEVIFEGTPTDLANAPNSLTAQYVRS